MVNDVEQTAENQSNELSPKQQFVNRFKRRFEAVAQGFESLDAGVTKRANNGYDKAGRVASAVGETVGGLVGLGGVIGGVIGAGAEKLADREMKDRTGKVLDALGHCSIEQVEALAGKLYEAYEAKMESLIEANDNNPKSRNEYPASEVAQKFVDSLFSEVFKGNVESINHIDQAIEQLEPRCNKEFTNVFNKRAGNKSGDKIKFDDIPPDNMTGMPEVAMDAAMKAAMGLVVSGMVEDYESKGGGHDNNRAAASERSGDRSR